MLRNFNIQLKFSTSMILAHIEYISNNNIYADGNNTIKQLQSNI